MLYFPFFHQHNFHLYKRFAVSDRNSGKLRLLRFYYFCTFLLGLSGCTNMPERPLTRALGCNVHHYGCMLHKVSHYDWTFCNVHHYICPLTSLIVVWPTHSWRQTLKRLASSHAISILRRIFSWIFQGLSKTNLTNSLSLPHLTHISFLFYSPDTQ